MNRQLVEKFQWYKINKFRHGINKLNNFGGKYGGTSRKVRSQLYFENIRPTLLIVFQFDMQMNM